MQTLTLKTYSFLSYFLILCLCRWHYLFLLDGKSATEVIKTFDKFFLFSGFKINNTKWEIAGIGVKKEVKMLLCGMKCVHSTDDVIKILGNYFSYNKKLGEKKNFLYHIIKIYLTIEGRIVVFKSLAIEKIIHLALIWDTYISN